MHLIRYLILTYCCVYVNSESHAKNDGGKKLVKAYIGYSSSERQFIGSLRKWIFGRGEEKEKDESKTKIKYLPIYVPVPVYSGMKVPFAGSEPYGAHQYMKKDEQEEGGTILNVPSKPSLPYPHTEIYELPFGSHLYPVMGGQDNRFNYKIYGEQLTKPARSELSSSYYNPYHGAYDHIYENTHDTSFYDDPEPTDYDSVVIDNPELLTDPNEDRNEDNYIRKRKKYRKKIN